MPTNISLPELPKSAKDKRSVLAKLAGYSLALALAALAVFGGWFWLYSKPLTTAGLVEGTVQTILAEGPAVVAEMLVQQGQIIQPGTQVLSLSGKAGASQAQGRARLKILEDTLKEQLSAQENGEKSAQALVEEAARKHAKILVVLRAAPAGGQNAATAAEEKKTRQALEAARQQLDAASHSRAKTSLDYQRVHAELMASLNNPEPREAPENPAAIAPYVALFASRVKALTVKKGDTVKDGQSLAVLVPVLAENLWVSACLDEQSLQKLAVNPQVRLHVEAASPLELDGLFEGLIAENADTNTCSALKAGTRKARFSLAGYDPLTMRLEPGDSVRVFAKKD